MIESNEAGNEQLTQKPETEVRAPDQRASSRINKVGRPPDPDEANP
jgi:hypothetical protein